MKKMILGSMVLASVLSASTMEKIDESFKGPSVTTQQPLKFQINRQTGAIEDASGSNLILEFCSAVGDIDAGYGALREEVDREIKKLDQAVEQMPPGSIERFGTEIYRYKFIKKNNKFIRLREDLFEYEPLLQEVLQAIYKSDSVLLSYSGGFRLAVPSYQALASQSFKEQLESFAESTGGVERVGKNYITFKIDSNLPIDLTNKLYAIFQYHPLMYKLKNVQTDIFDRSVLIYHIATTTESVLDTKRRLMLQFASDIAKLEGTSVLETLKKEIDDLIFKAEHSIIPKLAPIYMMAQIIMAFEEEAPRHRPQAAQ